MSEESTASLLSRIRNGHHDCRIPLVERYRVRYSHWLTVLRPDDESVINEVFEPVLDRSLDYMVQFKPVREGSFLLYLRQQVLDRLASQDQQRADTAESVPSAISQRDRSRFDTALTQLQDIAREAIICRIELGMSDADIAAALDCPTANAARNLVIRSIMALSEKIQQEGQA